MKRSRNPKKTRKKIIEATHKILREGGYLTKFSLDAVAQEAGVSKGGLMHHFGSKEALLHAAAQDTIERFEGRIAEEIDEEAAEAGRFTRAYINAVLGEKRVQTAELSPVLLSYIHAAGGGGKEEGSGRFAYWQSQTEGDGVDVVLATIIRLAIDGLIYTEIIDKQGIDEELRQQIRQRLLEWLVVSG